LDVIIGFFFEFASPYLFSRLYRKSLSALLMSRSKNRSISFRSFGVWNVGIAETLCLASGLASLLGEAPSNDSAAPGAWYLFSFFCTFYEPTAVLGSHGAILVDALLLRIAFC
jgi:hypothetical protein